ncbi:MAG: amidohydrolase [Myxococcales bacterium]|nr:amidohydrolase [Myxococcales bacterium]TDI95419.1 MAG: amidohydrolase [Deltaproteobacteria bacterium]TDJ05930.1 MAG: amidohydrolase [Deltaproteobacteria bacterium]
MGRYLVISSDCHAGLRPERYRDYLDPKYRDVFDVALPIQIQETEAAAKKFLVADINAEWRKGREQPLSGAWDHDERVKVLDGDGIAGEVIFPDGITEMNMPPFGAGLSLPTENVDPELQWAGARAHNRWLVEFCQMAPERRAGVAITPVLWDTDTAVQEIHWAKKHGLAGILIPSRWGKLDAYHHPKYEPIWAACEELGMVVHLHSGSAPMEDYGDHQGMMGIYITEVVWWSVRPLWFLIWGGVFERHPGLKLAITESTAIWVPEALQLMDQRYSESHYSAKLGDFRSHLSLKPSEYFRRNVFLGASCMPRREVELRHEIGLANIMWGSDYPHPEGSWPYTRSQMVESFRGVPKDELAAMLGGTAVALYGFDTEKLAPLVARIGPEESAFHA